MVLALAGGTQTIEVRGLGVDDLGLGVEEGEVALGVAHVAVELVLGEVETRLEIGLGKLAFRDEGFDHLGECEGLAYFHADILSGRAG